MIVSYIECFKEVFDKMMKPFVFVTFIFDQQIIGVVLFEQGRCNIILSILVLLKQYRSKWFIYAFKFGIKGTIVKLYLFNNRISFDVIMVIKKI